MSGLKTRLVSAAVLIPAVLALILLSPPWLFSLVAVLVAALSGFEFATIAFGGSFRLRRIVAALLSGLIAGSVVFHDSHPHLFLIAASAIVPISLLTFMRGFENFDKALGSAVQTATGVLYTGTPWGLLSLVFSSNDRGRYWVLALVVSSSLSDTLSFFSGKAFGRKKLAPRISPGKTWAGSVGGLAGSFAGIAAIKALSLPELGWLEAVALTAILGILFQLGDLAESFLKRGFGVKDSGGIIPGHGGILDRCDALMLGSLGLFLFIFFRSAL